MEEPIDLGSIWTFCVVFMAICGCVNVIWSAVKAIKEASSPARSVGRRLDKHDELLAADRETLDDLKECNRYQNKLMLQIANHLIDGNHTEALIRERDAMQVYLIDK